ncbi:MAG: YciI family protein [Actinomycetota bacterium]
MKYLLLIYVNPASRQVWEALPEDQRAEGFRAHAALDEELAASGELIVSEALSDESLAKRVSEREGRTVASDGPFAEAKEFLAGIYLIECESMDRAVEVAARMPEAPVGEIEVRPVMDLKGMEM